MNSSRAGMREMIKCHNNSLARVSSHPVGVFLTSAVGGEHTVLDCDPAQARSIAAALLRAADEAEGREAAQLVKYTRPELAAFIRANIDMKGIDFPDAEAVADWLEGK